MFIKLATNKDLKVIYNAVPHLFKEAMNCQIAVSDDALKALSKELVSKGRDILCGKKGNRLKVLY